MSALLPGDRVLFLGLGALVVVSTSSFQAARAPDERTYSVVTASALEMHVDGVLSEPSWSRADRETRFSYPWERQEPPSTEFRALMDDEHFYFAFQVRDDDLVIVEGDEESAVAGGDRVEIFFAADTELAHYACLEIGPRGDVLDYRASHYRRFDSAWSWRGLTVASRVTDSGYVVEGRLPHASFREAGLPTLADGEVVFAGVFRAEFSRGTGDEVVQRWISWVRPDVPEPDFHVPSAFGRFRRAPSAVPHLAPGGEVP